MAESISFLISLSDFERVRQQISYDLFGRALLAVQMKNYEDIFPSDFSL